MYMPTAHRRARCHVPWSSCGANERVPLVSVRNPGHQARGRESTPAHSRACVCVQNVPGAPGDFGVQEYHRWVCTCVWLCTSVVTHPHHGVMQARSCLAWFATIRPPAPRNWPCRSAPAKRQAFVARCRLQEVRLQRRCTLASGHPLTRVCVPDVLVDAQSIERCLRMSQVT